MVIAKYSKNCAQDIAATMNWRAKITEENICIASKNARNNKEP